MKFSKKKQAVEPKKTGEAPKGEEEKAPFWNYIDFATWTKICTDGEKQSPIKFSGSRSEIS